MRLLSFNRRHFGRGVRDLHPPPLSLIILLINLEYSIVAIMLGRLKMTVPQCIVAFPPLAKRIFKDGKRLPHHQKFRYKASYLVGAVKEILRQQGMEADERLFTGDQSGDDYCRT